MFTKWTSNVYSLKILQGEMHSGVVNKSRIDNTCKKDKKTKKLSANTIQKTRDSGTLIIQVLQRANSSYSTNGTCHAT